MQRFFSQLARAPFALGDATRRGDAGESGAPISRWRAGADRRALAAAERARQSAELQRLATEAELRLLRTHVNPHFLFNALSTLGHSMETDRATAASTLRQILNLLRDVLAKSNAQLVTLDDELTLVQTLAAANGGAGEATGRFVVHAPDDVRAARVPPQLLPMLVALCAMPADDGARRGSPAAVELRAVREITPNAGDGFLRLTLSSGGPLPAIDASVRSAVERRLQQHFGIQATMALRGAADAPVVDIVVPWITGNPPIVGSL